MIESLRRWFERVATGRLLGALCVLTAAVAAAFRIDMPGSTVPLVRRLGTVPILDARLYYTAAEARTVWERLGADGRKAYVLMHASLDLVFPALYGLLLTTAAVMLWRRAGGSRWVLVPLLAALCDYLENGALMLLMSGGFSAPLAATAGFLTLAKWAFTGASVLVLLYGVIVSLARQRGLSARR